MLQGRVGWIKSIAYSPDGSHLAIGAGDGTVRIWDLESGESHVLQGHAGGVNGVAYSPDGSHLTSAADDRTVRIWDVEEYQEVEKFAVIPYLQLYGANFELAIIDEKDKEILKAAGARI